MIALVRHDRGALAADDLTSRIGASARLAVDNERMRALLLAQVEDLRSSRARIVATSDDERRRLERDLHDGAQQRLLALTYELRMARSAAADAGDDGRAAVIDTTLAAARGAVDELRDIAHGIYPAVLSEAGLGEALRSLAIRAQIPVEIVQAPDTKSADAAERAVFVTVARTIEAVAHADAGDAHLVIQVRRESHGLVAELAPVDRPVEIEVADRIGALGGEVRVERGMLRAEVPCV